MSSPPEPREVEAAKTSDTGAQASRWDAEAKYLLGSGLVAVLTAIALPTGDWGAAEFLVGPFMVALAADWGRRFSGARGAQGPKASSIPVLGLLGALLVAAAWQAVTFKWISHLELGLANLGLSLLLAAGALRLSLIGTPRDARPNFFPQAAAVLLICIALDATALSVFEPQRTQMLQALAQAWARRATIHVLVIGGAVIAAITIPVRTLERKGEMGLSLLWSAALLLLAYAYYRVWMGLDPQFD